MFYFVNIGSKYKLMKHPYQPVGKVISCDYMNDTVTIEWIDKDLIPSKEEYPLSFFSDGSFELIEDSYEKLNAGINSCSHRWEHYLGFNEEYDYCSKCDTKKVNT